MNLIRTTKYTKHGVAVGFKNVGFVPWVLSKVFPYRLPPTFGMLLAIRGSVKRGYSR
jgi:hypothetical protein